MTNPSSPLLLQFVVGYVAILVVPGPNMLAVGGLAALRGFRASLPVCLGVALGATALAGLIRTAIDQHWQYKVQAIGGAFLLSIAYRVMKLNPGSAAHAHLLRAPMTEFSAGFFTALANPLTAGFFAAQLAGPLATSKGATGAALTAVPVLALLIYLAASLLFSREAVRERALAWQLYIRLCTASVLIFLAVQMLRSAIA